MERMHLAGLSVNPTLTLEDLGLDRRAGVDEASRGLTRISEARAADASDHWSPTSLQRRLVKTGGRLVKHARYYWLLLAEGHLTQRVFGSILRRIWALPLPTG